MEVILKTQKGETYLTTIFDAKSKEFKVIYLHEGQGRIMDKYTDPKKVIERHDFWCDIVGLIQKPYPRYVVEKHVNELATA